MNNIFKFINLLNSNYNNTIQCISIDNILKGRHSLQTSIETWWVYLDMLIYMTGPGPTNSPKRIAMDIHGFTSHIGRWKCTSEMIVSLVVGGNSLLQVVQPVDTVLTILFEIEALSRRLSIKTVDGHAERAGRTTANRGKWLQW